ncbi:MAG: T9SS type A sorting domain-containing protein [Candidatus Cloacimonetes bacterium]|nr:T9SS type A sorting domain-containing protein [Candidatus Cloacimonadota bacterium]
MKKIVFILFISFLISQICLGNPNITEQQDKLGVSIIGSRIQGGKSTSITWTGGGGNSDWDNEVNWDPTGLPDSDSDVIIPFVDINSPSMNASGGCRNMTINSGGIFTFPTLPSNTLYVISSFINNGDVYQFGGTLRTDGTITNNETYLAGGGTVLYGSTAISQSVTPSIEYHDLEVSGANKVLDGNTSVYGNTNLNGASIDVGNYDLTSYTGQFSQATPTQDYIITSGTGSLKYCSVITPTVVSGILPVGPDVNNYNPVSFNNNGVALNWFKTSVQPGIVPSHPNSSWCLPLTWDIKCDPLGSWNATIGFEWSFFQENSNFTQARGNNNVVLNVSEDGSSWQSLGLVTIASLGDDRHSSEFDNAVYVSEFALGDGDHTLPVELSAFTVQYTDNTPTLYWATQSEADNIGWNVYRNTEEDFGSSQKITNELIPGSGTTTEPSYYNFADNSQALEIGTTYWYWLESIDLGGESHYSNSVSITIPVPDEEPSNIELPVVYILNTAPNPMNSSTYFNFTLDKPVEATISIYNIKGELVRKLPKVWADADAETKVYWNGKDENGNRLQSGIYLYKLHLNGKTYKSERLILTR